MKNLLKKFRENKKGFTLAELLVVVAIVGILVAISVPVFTAQLGKARQATNNANLRAAKAAAVSMYLTDDSDNNGKADKAYVYDVDQGTVEPTTTTNKGTEVTINADTVLKTDLYKAIYVIIPKTDNGGDVQVTLRGDTDAPVKSGSAGSTEN